MKKPVALPLATAAMIQFACLLAAGTSSASDFMPTGRTTLQPVGHYEFCQREPSECRTSYPRNKPIKMTSDLWETLVAVNNAVNTLVQPRTDLELWGVEEYWSYPDLYGDCEDYVLEKRRLLIKAGLPASNLLITVVRRHNGEGHAVLTVSTTKGDFVLDNMEARILPWSATAYQYLKRQSKRSAAQWVSITDGRDAAVSSVSSNN